MGLMNDQFSKAKTLLMATVMAVVPGVASAVPVTNTFSGTDANNKLIGFSFQHDTADIDTGLPGFGIYNGQATDFTGQHDGAAFAPTPAGNYVKIDNGGPGGGDQTAAVFNGLSGFQLQFVTNAPGGTFVGVGPTGDTFDATHAAGITTGMLTYTPAGDMNPRTVDFTINNVTSSEDNPSGPAVPEPGTAVLLGSGLLGLAALRKCGVLGNNGPAVPVI